MTRSRAGVVLALLGALLLIGGTARAAGPAEPHGVYADAVTALRASAMYVDPSVESTIHNPSAGFLGDRFAKAGSPTRVAVLPAAAAATDAGGVAPAQVLRDALSAGLGPRSTFVVVTVVPTGGPDGGAKIGHDVAVVGGATDARALSTALDTGAATGRVDRTLDVAADQVSPDSTVTGKLKGLLGLPLLAIAVGWLLLRLARQRRARRRTPTP